MNKKTKQFSDKYNAKSIIKANKDTLIYWLDNNGSWLKDIFSDRSNGEYDRFIKEMSVSIEAYQRWMYLRGIKEGKAEESSKSDN